MKITQITPLTTLSRVLNRILIVIYLIYIVLCKVVYGGLVSKTNKLGDEKEQVVSRMKLTKRK